MESEINANNATGQNVKNEPEDDNENTPLRDEIVCSPEPQAAAVADSGWNTDDEDPVAPPVPPSPPLINLERIKRSPRFDDHVTHQSTSNAAENKESSPNIDHLLDSVLPELNESPEPPPPPSFDLIRIKSSPRGDDQSSPQGISNTYEEENAPKNICNDQLDVKFKREERDELQLDFLDALEDTDLLNVEMQTEPLVKTERALSANEQENDERDEEMEALTKMKSQLLETLSMEKDKKKKRKKEKKPKRERERERSRSGSPSRRHSSERSRKQRRINESSSTFGSKIAVKAEPGELDYVPVKDCERSIKIISINKLRQNATDPAPRTLGIMEKRKLAVERVKAVLNLMHRKASKIPETEFLVVDTIRKLPSSASVLSSAVFENPSPLCNNFNVNYKFNSTTKSNIDLSKWGLEAMPAVTTKLLQLTGIDVTRLMELKKNSKMSMHKLRLQQEANKAATKTEDECISTGLFRSLSTQTDARNFTKNVAVQTKATSDHHIFWLDSQFSESDLSQQQANVTFALKELCSTLPSSIYWADALYNALLNALKVKREEVKQQAMKKKFY